MYKSVMAHVMKHNAAHMNCQQDTYSYKFIVEAVTYFSLLPNESWQEPLLRKESF